MSKKAKVFWEVQCNEHGKQVGNNTAGLKSVIVPAPSVNKNHKKLGCPVCKSS